MWEIIRDDYNKHRVFFKKDNDSGVCIDCAHFGDKVGRNNYEKDDFRLPTLNDILVRPYSNSKSVPIIKEVLEQLANS